MLKIDIHFLPLRDPFLLKNTDEKTLHRYHHHNTIGYDTTGHSLKYINNDSLKGKQP